MAKLPIKKTPWLTRTLNRIGFQSQSQVDRNLDLLEKEHAAELESVKEGPETTDVSSMFQWDLEKDLTQKDLLEAMMYDVWLGAAIFVLQGAIAKLPWKITKAGVTDKGRPRREEVTDCETYKLLRDPNPAKFMTWYDLCEELVGYLEGLGESYWLLFNKDSRGKKVDWRLKVLRPDKMTLDLEKKTGAPKGWIYQPNESDESKTPYTLANIVQFKYFNPLDQNSGLASAVPAWESILTNRAARRVNRKSVENHYNPGTTIEFDKDAGVTDAQRKELQRKLQNKSKPKFAGENRVLPPGATEQKSKVVRDMQYGEMQKAVIYEIAAATGVPAALLGLSEEFNRANVNALLYVLYELTIKPKTEKIAAKITKQLLPLMDGSRAQEEDLKFVFDFSGVEALKQDPAKAALAVKLLTGRAIQSANEARERMGMESHPQPDADELYVKQSPSPPLPQTSRTGPEAEAREIEQKAAGLASASLPSYLKYLEPFDQTGLSKARIEQDPDGYKLWRKMVRATAPIEARVIAKIHRMAKRQRDEILEHLDRWWSVMERRGAISKSANLYNVISKAGPIIPADEFDELMTELLEFVAPQGEWLVEVLSPELEKALLLGGDFGAGDIVAGFDFNMKSRTVGRWQKQVGKRITTDIPRTTLRQFQLAMYKSWQAGGALRELKSVVKEQLGRFVGTGDYRAELISRTETIGAFNFGAVESYRQAKVDGTKIWHAAFDERVRDWHLDVEPVMKLRAPFLVHGPGGMAEMQYPGDPVGGGENVCNCRCTVSLIPKE